MRSKGYIKIKIALQTGWYWFWLFVIALEEMKRKWQERMKKVEELASHYERNPLPTVYRPRLSKPSMPSSVWKIFSRQAEAFNYVKTCQEVYYVLCLCSLYTFKIERNLNFLLAVKSLSVFFFPVLNQQIFVLVFVLFLLFFLSL